MSRKWIVVGISILLLALILILMPYFLFDAMKRSTTSALAPFQQANEQLKTEVYQLMNPTPTIIPDPVTIINEVRSLARLETIQYSVEKVITAEIGQGQFGFLFGDRLLFVAHGVVIAGFDLEKITSEDMTLDGRILTIRMPEPEVFIATLDNEKSYVFDREKGLLTEGSKDLESEARKVAEDEILKAAMSDGILELARQNGENYLIRLLRGLGYPEVYFTYAEPAP
jgi:hypothetical protein